MAAGHFFCGTFVQPNPIVPAAIIIGGTMARKPISVLITDLDNTLFDWVRIWHSSFSAMLASLVEQSGLSQAVLEREFKDVFQRYGTSEYAFALQELPSLKMLHRGKDVVDIYRSAICAFRAERRNAMELYPGVLETLEEIRDYGCLIVGYTESMAFYSDYRLRKLGLDRVLDYIYYPVDHGLPPGVSREQIRMYPDDHYQLRRTVTRNTPKGELKPSKRVLIGILEEVGAVPGEAAYVGDSLFKDIVMAQSAGVSDVWAKYGTAIDRPEYALLRRVTHWSSEMVLKEAQTTPDDTKPGCVLHNGFPEIKDLFEFHCFDGKNSAKLHVALDLWKKTVDVQQHFNDLALRIRVRIPKVQLKLKGFRFSRLAAGMQA
jgi:phosphoglycolate phosphatase-like HAD superfamily hydrolase